MKNLFIFFTFCIILCHPYCVANAGWIKQRGHAQIILSQQYKAFSQNYTQTFYGSGGPIEVKQNVKTSLSQQEIFAEVGLTQKVAFVFNSLASQINQDVSTNIDGKVYNYNSQEFVSNYVSFGIRRQIARLWKFAYGIQSTFILPGKMNQRQRALFGYAGSGYEMRQMIGIGTGEAFLNRYIKNKFKNKSARPLKLFAIVENGVRSNNYYGFYELRNDYTLGLEITDYKTMLLLQVFDVYQYSTVFLDGYVTNYKSNHALRKLSFSTFYPLTNQIFLGFSLIKETAGYLNTNANAVSINLWINT